MIGIYLITNKVNGKIYIGQSVSIERRWQEHKRSGQPDKYSIKSERDTKAQIHLAMQKYGINNFILTILEECERSQLNEREQYWIQYYHSNDKNIGYNLTTGGQENFKMPGGEAHSQAKLSQKDVDKIKELLKTTDLNLVEIQKQFFPGISKSTLSMINHGKVWYNKNETYPLRVISVGLKGSKSPKAKFTEEQVMEMRTLYSKGVSLKDIQSQYHHIASDSAIKAIIYNKTYRHLPQWNKKTQQWI